MNTETTTETQAYTDPSQAKLSALLRRAADLYDTMTLTVGADTMAEALRLRADILDEQASIYPTAKHGHVAWLVLRAIGEV